MIKKLFAFAITSGLAAQALRMWMERDRHRKQETDLSSQPAEVQRWEDEAALRKTPNLCRTAPTAVYIIVCQPSCRCVFILHRIASDLSGI